MTFRRILIIVCFMCLALPNYAQEDMPPADYIIEGKNGEFNADFQWLPDGTGLRVINVALSGEQVFDFQYDLATQSAQPSSEQRIMSRLDQLNLLDSESASTSGIVFMSPDQQWVVYGVIENEKQ